MYYFWSPEFCHQILFNHFYVCLFLNVFPKNWLFQLFCLTILFNTLLQDNLPKHPFYEISAENRIINNEINVKSCNNTLGQLRVVQSTWASFWQLRGTQALSHLGSHPGHRVTVCPVNQCLLNKEVYTTLSL